MKYDLNEIYLSGIINNITDNRNDYIKFGLTSNRGDKKIYSSLNVNRNLYEKYKDFFVKENHVFIKGYLNSFINDNKIHSFITVVDLADNELDIKRGSGAPHIRDDPDGVEVWNGKRAELKEMTKEEQKELQDIIDSFK